jgi:type VI secretion system secreted protein VgrG
MNAMPGLTKFDEGYVLRWPYADSPVAQRKFQIVRGDGTVVRGTTDASGNTGLQKSDFIEALNFQLLPEA